MDDATAFTEKQQSAEALRRHLKTAKGLRERDSFAPAAAQARLRLREWQAARLARTHADLLASPRFGQAAQFFLSDLSTYTRLKSLFYIALKLEDLRER